MGPTRRGTVRAILAAWWPLAASWWLMSVELPALSAVVARLPDPKVHLAAYGSVVFPLSLFIEAPVVMLLAASTALSRDERSYRLLHRFMTLLSLVLTGVHAAVAFTPLYDLVVGRIVAPPPEVAEAARVGMGIMLPWTWAIAYRRFHQGVLIRFGDSRGVGLGTLVRLGTDVGLALLGYRLGLPGIVVASTAVATGVVAEAAFVRWRVAPILRGPLREAPAADPPLTLRAFLEFYTPLALTSVMTLAVQPLGSTALSRMPDPLTSLALWPVVSGLTFMLRSPGLAYNEVAVAFLDAPDAYPALRRVTRGLAAATTGALLLVAATPLARLWLEGVTGLAPELAAVARQALWLTLPLPALSVLQSWYQAFLLHSRRTRGVSEAVALFLTSLSLLLGAGVLWGRVPGIYVGAGAFSLGAAIQVGWLRWRSAPARRRLAVLPADG